MHRILTAVFVLAAFAAGAVEITTDTTVSVTANSAESYEIADGATLTFSVASGATFTLSGAITGGGAVRKEGSGELILSNSANSFSGGMYNNEGKLRATASGAFGTGGITNNGPARLIFDAQGGVFQNSICMTGECSNYPADPVETVSRRSRGNCAAVPQKHDVAGRHHLR